MTWSYSGDPSASDLDEVRFLCGDTDTTDQLVTDEEVLYGLTKAPTADLAAAMMCDAISAKLTREADRSVGDVSIQLSQRAEAYAKLADRLRSSGAAYALPVFGGITIAGNKAIDDDAGAMQPSFRIGQDDNPVIPPERGYRGGS